MKRKHLFAGAAVLGFLAVTLGVARFAPADEPKERAWDQDEAVAKVEALIAKEEAGDFAWDNIPWMTDPDKAVALAQEEQKPIFFYFFLKGTSGPAAAPC